MAMRQLSSTMLIENLQSTAYQCTPQLHMTQLIPAPFVLFSMANLKEHLRVCPTATGGMAHVSARVVIMSTMPANHSWI